MSRNRDHRYYEDSDDMVERIRRAREAFEKETKAFQGPDWPHYEKRVIVGQKKKEDMDPSVFQRASVAVSSSSSSQPNRAPENDPATTADQTSSWWAAHREARKASATAETTDQSATATDRIDDKAAS